MSLSLYVSMSFLFHTGLSDIQFHTLYTVACPKTCNSMVSYLSAVVQYEYPGKNNVFIQLMSGNTE